MNQQTNKDILNILNSMSKGKKGIGHYVMTDLLNPKTQEGMDNWLKSNEDIALIVREKFNSQTQASSIAWYKGKIKKQLQLEVNNESK